jgi:hypothetical protein
MCRLLSVCAQIIALANLRQKATHSAQTVLSGFRREGTSQTWLPKEAAVQTKVGFVGRVPGDAEKEMTGMQGNSCVAVCVVRAQVNKGSSVPKKLRYVTGLRGGPDTKMAVVSLELDVHGKGAGVLQQQPGRRQ